MGKSNTTVTIENDLKELARLKGINISEATVIGINILIEQRNTAEQKLDAERKRIADATLNVSDIKRRELIDSIKRNIAFKRPLTPFMVQVYADVLKKPEYAEVKDTIEALIAIAQEEKAKEVLP
jgi:post-segregation antitoxin (ccd killing protein)